MKFNFLAAYCLFCLSNLLSGQSISFQTYVNPVIPGDHPDPTLTKIGNDFYSSGSSFNPTPRIYHSTDLVHWDVIAQPISASWADYGNSPGGGVWGGHMVLYNGVYWHYFGRGAGSMYFVTADQPEGPWSMPTEVKVPDGLADLGVDNSIFIDEEYGKWYLLSKAGRENNHILELGADGHPTGDILDLTWLNPDSEGNPYGWAEGPVMWKYRGYYYYSFAQHLAGSQYVMRSDTLNDDENDWTIIGSNIFNGSSATFNRPNHISPVVMLDDSTSWTMAHSYHKSSEWFAHGRQGLLCRVTYNEDDFPEIQYPPSEASLAPDLPGTAIPWVVPQSDMFNGPDLKAEWSFLGYVPGSSYSLNERDGWLHVSAGSRTGTKTVIQNDGEHNFSLITKVDFEAANATQQAGLQVINGPESYHARVYSTKNSDDQNVLAFSLEGTKYEVENSIGSVVWLKLIRNEHEFSGYYSMNGFAWQQIGKSIIARALDYEVTDFNSFTGNQQGLYVWGASAYFDLYIYRDAYTEIPAGSPANRFGTTEFKTRDGSVLLSGIDNNDWAMYAAVEFGNDNYLKQPDSLEFLASASGSGGFVEVWLDAIDTGEKIAECVIGNTVDFDSFEYFKTTVDSVKGRHDVYLRFLGDGADLYRIMAFKFISNPYIPLSINTKDQNGYVNDFKLNQNYPNPFNPVTTIQYSVALPTNVSLNVYDILGKKVATLTDSKHPAGDYSVTFDGTGLAGGIYVLQLKSDHFVQTKKCVLLK